MRIGKATTVIALATLLLGHSARAEASAILNGGFEEGSFAGWTLDLADAGSLLFESGGGHDDAGALWFGAMDPLGDTLMQTFATTPGDAYILTFWLAHTGTKPGNAFSVTWDGVPVLNLVDATRFGYREYTYLHTATDLLSTISFTGRDTFSYYRLDDVSITPVVTPEPATIVLLGSGIAAAYYKRRGRARHVASIRHETQLSVSRLHTGR